MLLSPLSFFSRLFVNLHLTGPKLIFMFASLNNQETSQVGASIYRYIYRFAQMISSYKRGLHILVWWKGQILFESNVPILFQYPKPDSVLYPSTQFKPHSQSCSGNFTILPIWSVPLFICPNVLLSPLQYCQCTVVGEILINQQMEDGYYINGMCSGVYF